MSNVRYDGDTGRANNVDADSIYIRLYVDADAKFRIRTSLARTAICVIQTEFLTAT